MTQLFDLKSHILFKKNHQKLKKEQEQQKFPAQFNKKDGWKKIKFLNN